MLSNGFKSYKKEGDKWGDQPLVSSEILMSNLTQTAADEYIPPEPPKSDRGKGGSSSPSDMAPRIPGIDNSWHVNNILREVDVVQKIYEHIKNRMRSAQIEWDDFMLEDNIQKNTENLADPHS